MNDYYTLYTILERLKNCLIEFEDKILFNTKEDLIHYLFTASIAMRREFISLKLYLEKHESSEKHLAYNYWKKTYLNPVESELNNFISFLSCLQKAPNVSSIISSRKVLMLGNTSIAGETIDARDFYTRSPVFYFDYENCYEYKILSMLIEMMVSFFDYKVRKELDTEE